ncbi:MAG TPA: hypothetical protein VK154_08565 [Chitinophagales bacterium]|nr:hypothetical protein [Chitinophagales bacterium]
METTILPQEKEPKTLHERICLHMYVLFNNPDVSEEYYRQLTDEERKELSQLVSNKIDELAAQQTTLQKRLSLLTEMNYNDMRREYSLNRIRTFVRQHLLATGFMPTMQKIAQETGLSRKTVTKHMEDFVEGQEDILQLRLMRRDVMSTVLNKAINDKSLSAAKMYIDEVKTIQQEIPQGTQIVVFEHVITQKMVDDLSYWQKERIAEIWLGKRGLPKNNAFV